MSDRPGQLWQESGWRVVGRKGVIEYSLNLPGTLPYEPDAVLYREAPGKPWKYRIGGETDHPKWAEDGREFKTAAEAARHAEGGLKAALIMAISMLRTKGTAQ